MLTIPVSLLLLHFVADFVLQTDWMAINKSKRWDALTAHVSVYSLIFTIFLGVWFGAITFATHFVTDALTSRWSRRLFPWLCLNDPDNPRLYVDMEGLEGRSRHWFFVVLGLDQFIHCVTLALAYQYIWY